MRARRLAGLGALVVALASSSAFAHIKLLVPPSWVVENATGDPQKVAPCGGTAGTPTGIVTTFHTGETITAEWQETVGHPGHFRISLATDRADLVDPPVVTSTGDGKTGTSISAAIMDPPVYPVLLDGLFPRATVSGAQAAPFTQQVTLPTTPCEKCTLQVIQFMAGHPPGYFYHHCADLRIVADGASAGDAGGDAAPASASSGEKEDGGCTVGRGPRFATLPLRSLAAWIAAGCAAGARRRSRRRSASRPVPRLLSSLRSLLPS